MGVQPTENVYQYPTIDSTNSQCRRLAESGHAPEWTVVVADVQTEGHGRKGRAWLSPLGGLWFSVVLRPKLSVLQSSLLQFYAANGTRRFIERFARMRCGMKWPNDLILDGRKVGGILVETKLSGEEVLYAVLGIGVNLNVAGRLIPETATSILQLTGRHVDRDEAWRAIVGELRSTYGTLDEASAVVEEWWANCVHKDKPVELDMPDSSRIAGTSVGLDAGGQLVVRTEGGRLVKVSDGTLRALL